GDTAPDDALVGAQDPVGGSVTQLGPKIGRTLDVAEEDRQRPFRELLAQGSTSAGSLAHCWPDARARHGADDYSGSRRLDGDFRLPKQLQVTAGVPGEN